MRIWRGTRIRAQGYEEPILRAVKSLKRDIENCCLELKPEDLKPEGAEESEIVLKRGDQEEEQYRLYAHRERLIVEAGSILGFVYGIYAISREILGVRPFWFWNDQQFRKRESYSVREGYCLESRPFAVKLRGWMINDEVLLHAWFLERDKDKPWEMALEALLRCGGNMVIPGTDRNSKKYRGLAQAMGLMITHHHSEPLGAEMFARAYPDLKPSFAQYPELFRGLWKEAVCSQAGQRVIWNLGFRGQGDVPFWENDPRYDTKEARGELISSLLKEQYAMVKEMDQDALCCTNLYGEVMELYKEGCIRIPEDVIKVWGDNGFGKMVTRRQENHNPRIPSLPGGKGEGKNGIYYHVSFYDLQAANHMTMLPNPPEFVREELRKGLERGTGDYWLINCSNIKPHVYYLDLIARFWQDGDVDVEAHRSAYFVSYYGERYAELLGRIHKGYFSHALAYGPHEDDHAGEQFPNHVARMLIHQFVKDQNQPYGGLLWGTKAKTLKGQLDWYGQLCMKARERYGKYLDQCVSADTEMDGAARRLYRDSLLLQAQIYFWCYRGAFAVCRALDFALKGVYQKAFYCAGKAKICYERADESMRRREHGKWQGFYANECLTDMKQTAWVLEGLMSYLRNIREGPHYYQWQRDFLYSEKDRRVMLVMNMENHLKDQELYQLMEAALGDELAD